VNARARIVLLGALLLAGCSHAPKPTAEVPPDEGKSPGTTHAKRPAAPKPPTDASAGAVVGGSSTSAPAPPDTARAVAVVPQLSSEEAKELDKSSREQIDTALQKLATVDATKLDPDKQRKLEIAQGFLKDAVEARKQQDWMRASQLATKARVLADELTAR
jgi:hypothetical protein